MSDRMCCACACGCGAPITDANRRERIVAAGERDWNGEQLTPDVMLIVCPDCLRRAVEPNPGGDFSCWRDEERRIAAERSTLASLRFKYEGYRRAPAGSETDPNG